MEIKVLNDGFVRLVDIMGNDAAIVQAARVSYGEGTKTTQTDEQLIRYLMRHKHTSPFEMCEMKFHVRVPMDTWRQWIRHRTASVNEYSTRYSKAIDSMQSTGIREWRLQSSDNKQGSSGTPHIHLGEVLSVEEDALQVKVWELYEHCLKEGIAREQARKNLLLSTYTEAYWKIDLHNLLHFLALRLHSHAQWEIRQYAAALLVFVQNSFPLTYKAFQDYTMGSVSLTALDQQVIRALQKSEAETVKVLLELEWATYSNDSYLPTLYKQLSFGKYRERLEFEEKAKSLGLEGWWKE